MKVGRAIISMVICTALIFSGCATEDEEYNELVAVSPFTAISKDFEKSLSYSGHVAAEELKRFSFETAGTIKEICVEKGEAVKKGQLLASLDTETIQMEIDNANEKIALANNKISQANTTISEQEIGIESEELTLNKLNISIDTETINLKKIKDTYNSAITKIQLNYDDAKQKYEDTQTLYDSGGCSKYDLDKAKLSFDTIAEELENEQITMDNDVSAQNKKLESLNNDYELQKVKIENQKNKLEQSKQQKQAAEIELNQAKINLDKNETILKNSTIESTIDGYVTEVPMNAGEVTSAGNPVVVVKSSIEVVNVSIPTEDYDNFYVGMLAKLTQDEIDVDGKVTAVELYPDENTRTYNVEITPSKAGAFALGSIVDVKVSLDKNNFIVVPLSSILDIDGVDYVYCIDVNENNQNVVKSKEIKLEQADGNNAYISGIDSNTLIVANEVKNLHDNQVVKLIGG